MGSKDKLKEYGYEELKRFFEVFWEFKMNILGIAHLISDEANPVSIINRKEKTNQSKSVLMRGMVITVQDSIEETNDWEYKEIKQLDKILSAKNIVTLSALRSILSIKLSKLLKRGKIRNDEEFYLLKDRVDDVDNPELSQSDREKAEKLLMEYELRDKK